MNAKLRRFTKGIALLLLLTAVHSASAFYDPHVGRWVSRDPIGEPGFKLVSEQQSQLQTSTITPYVFVENNPIVFTDSLGLYSFGTSCNQSQRNQIASAIKKNCDAAKRCCANTSLGAVTEAINKLCNQPSDPYPVINCPDENTTLPDGRKCTVCGVGFESGQQIFLCPGSFDPRKQDRFGCPLNCVVFHEAVHTRGVKHGSDMSQYDKCMGCTPQP